MASTRARTKRIAVQFGGVSIGEETARIGIKISREDIDLLTAEELFCGRRLTGKVKTAKTTDDPNQQELPGVEDTVHEIASTFDVKRMGVSPTQITAGLTFALSEIDVSELGHFAKRSGWLTVESAADLEDDDEDDDE